MSKWYVQHGDGTVDMAGLTTLRSFLAKVKTHTLRDESKGPVRPRCRGHSFVRGGGLHIFGSGPPWRKCCRHSAHSCLIWDASGRSTVSCGRVHSPTTCKMFLENLREDCRTHQRRSITACNRGRNCQVGGLHKTPHRSGQGIWRGLQGRCLRGISVAHGCRPTHSWSYQWRCPFLKEQASDAVGHLRGPPEAASQCV